MDIINYEYNSMKIYSGLLCNIFLSQRGWMKRRNSQNLSENDRKQEQY